MPLVERFVIGVDMHRYSARVTRHQFELQRALARMLDEAAEAADLRRKRWKRQKEGDGEIAILPARVDLVAAVRHFVSELDIRLADHNEDHAPGMLIRLRVAMHTDSLTEAEFGYAGPALIVLSRLLNSTPVRKALTNTPEAHLAQIISEPVFQRAVVPEVGGLRQRQFQQVQVDLPEKEFQHTAYLYVPGARAAPSQSVRQSQSAPQRFPIEIFRSPAAPPAQPRTEAVEPVIEARAAETSTLSEAVRELVREVQWSLDQSDIKRADILTTRALLESADRTRIGSLNSFDSHKIPAALLTALDAAWAKFSSGAWGFDAQRRRRNGLGLSDPRSFRALSVLVGWRADEMDVVLRYPEFAQLGEHTVPFYPTLRNPEREAYSGWHDAWKATVMSVHLRLRDWES